jgi:hypothetical protein
MVYITLHSSIDKIYSIDLMQYYVTLIFTNLHQSENFNEFKNKKYYYLKHEIPTCTLEIEQSFEVFNEINAEL